MDHDDSIIVVVKEERLDSDNMVNLKSECLELLKQKKGLIIDLTNVHFLESAAIGFFLMLSKKTKEFNASIKLINVRDNVKRGLKDLHVDAFIGME